MLVSLTVDCVDVALDFSLAEELVIDISLCVSVFHLLWEQNKHGYDPQQLHKIPSYTSSRRARISTNRLHAFALPVAFSHDAPTHPSFVSHGNRNDGRAGKTVILFHSKAVWMCDL